EREPLEDDVPGEVHLGGAAGGTEEVHSSGEPRRAEGGLVAVRVAAHLADQVNALPPGQVPDAPHDVHFGGIEADMSPHSPRELEPGGIEVAGDHERSASRPGHADGEASDGAAAEYQHRAAGNVAALQHGVHGVPHRVHDGPDLRGNAVELHHV